MMDALDAVWWLVLGLLSGWVGLWLFDRLMLRDGEVAGLRAARELAEARHSFDSALADMSARVREADGLRSSLENTQGDVRRLQGELADSEAGRADLLRQCATVEQRVAAVQGELDEARRTIADRASEIERLKKQLMESGHQRDAADRWAQVKDNEASELRARLDALTAEHESRGSELGALRPAHETQERALATLRASYDALEADHARLLRQLPSLRHDLQSVRRRLRELDRRLPAASARDRGRGRGQPLRARLRRLAEGERLLDALNDQHADRQAALGRLASPSPEETS